jgi:hypothetical protein
MKLGTRWPSVTALLTVVAAGWAALGTAYSQSPPTIWQVPKKPMTTSEAREFLSCKTRMSFMQGHGTQVSFTAPDGKVFLWYPGNRVVLSGQWEVRLRAISSRSTLSIYAEICFRYGTNTFNPVTGTAGNTWGCMPADLLASLTTDSADGDLFNLHQRPVPAFVLSPEKTSLKQLEERAGQSGNPVPKGVGSGPEGCDKPKTS